MKLALKLFVVFAFLLSAAGCPPTGVKNSSAPDVAAESWVARPPQEWPQLVLTNEAEFQGHTSLQGASAFLVKTRDGRTLAATARHLLGPNGGVEPELSVSQLNGALRSWRMHPRTLPDNFVEIHKVGATGLDDPRLDWLLLTIKPSESELPATPLTLRSRPVEVGETVYLVGCPYVEADCKQNVYTGKITARQDNLFRYDIDPPVDIRGFSGAPILDQKGHVVGVMTVWFEPKLKEEKFLEAGGEDAASVYSLLEKP